MGSPGPRGRREIDEDRGLQRFTRLAAEVIRTLGGKARDETTVWERHVPQFSAQAAGGRSHQRGFRHGLQSRGERLAFTRRPAIDQNHHSPLIGRPCARRDDVGGPRLAASA